MTTTLKRAGTVTFTNGSPTVVGVGTFFSSLPDGSLIRKYVSTGAPNDWYAKTGHTSDLAMTIEPPWAGSTSGGGGDEYDAVVFQQGTLADAVNLFSLLSDRFNEIVQLTAHDRTLTLNRDSGTDNAGIILQANDVDQFRFGAFGDNNLALLRKVGVSWVDVFTVDVSTGVITFSAGAITSSLQPRNRMFNGAMRLSSVNGGSVVDVNGATTEVVNGWSVQTAGGGVIRGQQVAGPTPGGSSSWERLLVQTVDASVAAGDIYRFFATLKGRDIADLKWGTAGAQPLTLQFAHNAGIAGTYCVGVRNAAGTRSLVKEFTVSSGQVGNDVTRTITFAGDTAGTWLTDDSDALIITFDFGSGSNFTATVDAWSAGLYTRTTGQVNVIGNASISTKISDVAWYVGSNAPTYELPAWEDELIRLAVDYNTDQTTLALRKNLSIAGTLAVAGAGTITSASANALSVGRQGTTSPAFQVDASAATSVTGWAMTAAALAAGAFLAVISPGANESGVINAKGTGTVSLQTVATGNLIVGANKLTVDPVSGNTVIAGTLGVTGNLAINTNKFNVTASNGNTSLSGTLVSGGNATFGSNQGDATTPSTTNTNVILYNINSTNWAGIGADTSGNVYFKTGLTGTPAARMAISAAGIVSISTTTVSTSPTTGALVVSGGVGISGALMISGLISTGPGGTGAVNAILNINGGSAAGGGAQVSFNTASGVGCAVGSENSINGSGVNNKLMFYNGGGGTRFVGFGAGSVTSDAAGNVTTSSDADLKIDLNRPFTKTINDLMVGDELMAKPKWHRWRPEANMDDGEYVGFFAQDYERGVPEAIGLDARGKRTFSDRVAIAVLHNTAFDHEMRLRALEGASQQHA